MVGLIEALGNTAKSVYCSTAAPISVGLGILGNVYKGLGGVEQGDDLIAAGQLYRNGQNAACNRTPDSVSGELSGPFSGGQCPGVSYSVTATRSVTISGGSPSVFEVSGTGLGPLSFVQGFDDPQPASGDRQAVVDASGDTVVQASATSTASGVDIQATLTNINVVRVDGLPDDCGSVPPQVPVYDPAPWTGPQPVTYDDDGGNSVTINPTFTFGPGELGPGGELTHPIEVEFENGITLNLNFDVETGDISLFGPGNGGPGDPVAPQEEEEEQPENPEVSDLIGVRIIVTPDSQQSSATEIVQTDGNPNVYVPRVGVVAFRYQTSTDASGWGTDISVKNLNFVVWADRPAIEVRATPDDGWDFEVRPIREKRESCCD